MTKTNYFNSIKALLFGVLSFILISAQAQVPSYVPTDGLVGYWPFNGNANDESGNGNDGTVNGATLTEDLFGNTEKAYSLEAGNSISTSYSPTDVVSTSYSAWFKTSSGGCIIGSNANNFSPNLILAIHTNSTSTGNQGTALWVVDYAGSSVGWMSQQPADLLYNDNQWHHIVGIYNCPSGNIIQTNNLSLFVDGQIITSIEQNVNPSNSPINILSNLVFGMNQRWIAQGFDGSFIGSLDDIGIWNRALTEAEIQALYVGCNVAPTTIAGSVNPFTLTSSNYACNNNPGSTYEWTITNGVITTGQGTSNVTVLWGEEGAGTLTVLETNTEGCSGTPATIEVMIECATTATTLDGPLGPNALTETTYTCNGAANSTFEWTISNGVITSGQGTNTVTVLWAGTGLGSISVQETTNANCMGDLISINVVVIPTAIDELNQSNLFLYPNPANDEITLQTNQSSIGNVYIIVDQTGKQIASGKITGTNTTIKLDQFASGMYTIIRDGKTSQQFQVIK